MGHAIAFGTPMLLGAVMLGSVSIAQAVDVQGTWDGKVTCTGYPNGAKPEMVKFSSIVQVSQTGTDLLVEVGGLTTFFGFASDDGIHANKGVVGGGSCPSPGAGAGFFGKVNVNGDDGSLVLDITGGAFGTPLKCHVTAKRSSAVDPGVAPCP